MGALLNIAAFVLAIGVGIWFVSLAVSSFGWQPGRSRTQSNSLTESELRSMIEDVVEKKVHQLERKIDKLDRRLGDGRS